MIESDRYLDIKCSLSSSLTNNFEKCNCGKTAKGETVLYYCLFTDYQNDSSERTDLNQPRNTTQCLYIFTTSIFASQQQQQPLSYLF